MYIYVCVWQVAYVIYLQLIAADVAPSDVKKLVAFAGDDSPMARPNPDLFYRVSIASRQDMVYE